MTMSRSFSFIVPGEVRGQGRPRTTIRGGYASIYDSPEDKANKHNIQLYASEAMRAAVDDSLIDSPLKGISIAIDCYVRVPESMSKKKKEMAYRGEILPLRKPDLDNVMKAVLDACNGVVWRDDKEVTKAQICRYYSDMPRLVVRVSWEEEARQ